MLRLAWATCSPDAWAYDRAWGLVEAKTSSNPQDWGTPGHYSAEEAAEHVPSHYLTQCLWELLVTGLPWCDLVALIDRGFDLRIYRIHTDAELQADLFAQVSEWRQQHLIEGKPLQIDGSEACRRVVERPPTDPGREATEQEAALIQALAVAKAHVEQWQATEEMAKNFLLQSMGPAERLYTADGWRITRANGLRLWQPKETK